MSSQSPMEPIPFRAAPVLPKRSSVSAPESVSSRAKTLVHSKEWRSWPLALGLSFVSIALHVLTVHFIPASAYFHPEYSIALITLYFCGVELFPLVYGVAVVGGLVAGDSAPALYLAPLVTLQAALGGYVLRAWNMDPLFRHRVDLGVVLLVCGICSTILLLPQLIQGYGAQESQEIIVLLTIPLMGIIFSYACTVPFLLRWITKPYFTRSNSENFETLLSFVILICVCFYLFVLDPTSVDTIARYLILLPFFWISLRLRPRFVTLAVTIAALCAVVGSFMLGPAVPLTEWVHVELFIVALSACFLLIATLEEDRRVSGNLMHFHLSTLENMVLQGKSESQAKNDFIATLAHELRNPLAPIVSGVEILQLRSGWDNEESEMLAVMADRLESVNHILNDSLDVSRIAEGKITLDLDTVDIRTALNGAIVSTEHLRGDRHQTLQYQAPNTPLYVQADKVRLEQVFSNILSNASRYSHAGDTIVIKFRIDQRLCAISFIDHGIGIDTSSIDKIFQPFFQVNREVHGAAGLGLGLALVKNLVSLQGGTIKAQSEGRGKGSTFTVRLPILDEKAAKKKEFNAVFADLEVGTKTAIIIDDNDASAATVGRLLFLEGYSVSYAYDAYSGVDMSIRLKPGIIFWALDDIRINTIAVCEYFRDRGYEGKIIALVRKGAHDDGFEYFDAVLEKPAKSEEVRNIVKNLS